MSARIIRSDAGGLATLTLDRPEKLNALDTPAFAELDAHCAALEQESHRVGCVVLRANGRAFCAGADLGQIAAEPVDPRFKPGVIDRLSRLPQPVIAAVHGVCFTGGLELALAADIIVADRSARFADTHGKWGFVGAWGMSQRLPRRIGMSAAKMMMFTAQPVDAARALEMGLIDILFEEGGLAVGVAGLAEAILGNSWHTNIETKRLMRETEGMMLEEGLAWENFRNPGFAPDYRERIARFTK